MLTMLNLMEIIINKYYKIFYKTYKNFFEIKKHLQSFRSFIILKETLKI